MRLRINCPRCNSEQAFRQRKRQINKDQHEVYIQCRVCRWTHVVLSADSDKILNEKEIEKLKIRATRDPQLYEVLRRKLKKRNGK